MSVAHANWVSGQPPSRPFLAWHISPSSPPTSLTSVLGFATESPLTAVGFLAWGPLLLAIAVLLTAFFHRSGRGRPGSSDERRLPRRARAASP